MKPSSNCKSRLRRSPRPKVHHNPLHGVSFWRLAAIFTVPIVVFAQGANPAVNAKERYRDAQLAINDRVADLLSRLTRSIDVDPKKAPAVKRIFELYASGRHSLTSLPKAVRSETGFLINRSYLETILKNRFLSRFLQLARIQKRSSADYQRSVVPACAGRFFKPQQRKAPQARFRFCRSTLVRS